MNKIIDTIETKNRLPDEALHRHRRPVPAPGDGQLCVRDGEAVRGKQAAAGYLAPHSLC